MLGRVSLERLVDLTTPGPARLFGIAQKGARRCGDDGIPNNCRFKTAGNHP